MVANPSMINAYKAGIPGNGRPFPEGSKIAKLEWRFKKSTEAPFSVNVPEVLQDVFFIEKDSTRFPDTSVPTHSFTSRGEACQRLFGLVALESD
jgi:hypothetical protein